MSRTELISLMCLSGAFPSPSGPHDVDAWHHRPDPEKAQPWQPTAINDESSAASRKTPPAPGFPLFRCNIFRSTAVGKDT